MKTVRTFNDIGCFDLCLTSGEVGKKNLFRAAVLTSETEIPLSGVKGTHSRSSISQWARGTGLKYSFYKAREENRSREIGPVGLIRPIFFQDLHLQKLSYLLFSDRPAKVLTSVIAASK